MTTYSDMLSHLGGLPVMGGLPFSGTSRAFFLDPTAGSDSNDGTTPAKAKATLAAAYALLTDGKNDTLFYIAGATGLTMSAALDWAKSYTHFVGVCAPVRAGQRARIFQLSTLTAASPLITISGSGCVFKDLYIFQGVADNTSLINVSVTGDRNYFQNVHFAGGGHATQAVDGGASLQLNGAMENLFVDCTIGVDTIAAATGMMGLLVPATGGAGRNWFERCHFNMWAGHTNAAFAEFLGNSGLDRWTVFKDCLFTNLGTAMASALVIAAGFDPANKRLLLMNCAGIGFTDWDASARGIAYLTGGTQTAGTHTGLFQVSTV